MEKYRAVNFTTSWSERGGAEVGSHCCSQFHASLGEAINCFESHGEDTFGAGFHGGGHEFRAYDEENRFRSIDEASEEWQEGVEEALRLK